MRNETASQQYLQQYREWYLSKFNTRLLKQSLRKTIMVRVAGEKLTLHYDEGIFRLVCILGDMETFIKYADFVFENWHKCKNAEIRYFINWLFSVSMLKRFQDIMMKEKLISKKSPTYSDHSDTGYSNDKEIDMSGLFHG